MGRNNGNSSKATTRASLVMLTVVFGVFLLARDLDAASNGPQSRQGASATLHISVNLIPVVQTGITVAAPRQSQAITYSMENAPREQRHEIHLLPSDPAAPAAKRGPAILKTLVVVPE